MQKYLALDIKKLLVAIAAVVMSVGLTAGLASASTGSIDTTGPGSDNSINYENESDVDVDNTTDVSAGVDINQDADSGETKVKYNTSGGSAESGDAMNDNYVEAAVSVDNSSSSEAALSNNNCGCDDEGSIENTGPESDNHITFANNHDVEVENDTDVDFHVDVEQDAETGDASVYSNTTGGDAVSGSASNTSTVMFSLDVTN